MLQRWTNEETEKLKEMLGEGKSYNEIAETLRRTNNAARKKAQQLGLRKSQNSHKVTTPLYKGGLELEENKTQNKSPKDLIELEWQIINRLKSLTESTRNEKQRGFYYQTLASHIRTLSNLIKNHGEPKETQDLAKLLEEIQKRAKRLLRRLTTYERRTRRTH